MPMVYVAVYTSTFFNPFPTVHKEDGTKVSVSLMICTTRDTSKLQRFQFEIVTPNREPIVLQVGSFEFTPCNLALKNLFCFLNLLPFLSSCF